MNAHLSQEALAIQGVVKLRDKLSELSKTESELKAAKKTLEAYLLGVMVARGEKQIKTDDGTAYISLQTRVSMVDREALIKYVCDRIEENDPRAFDLFTNHVSKEEAVRLSEEGIPLPFVKIDKFEECHVNRA